MQSLGKYAPYALAMLRIVTALLFIEHGTAKLFGFPAMSGPGSAGGSLPPILLLAAILEVLGGLAILFGFFTRPVAFILSGLMAVAYWMAHVPKGGFFPLTNGGDAAVLAKELVPFLAGHGRRREHAQRDRLLRLAVARCEHDADRVFCCLTLDGESPAEDLPGRERWLRSASFRDGCGHDEGA